MDRHGTGILVNLSLTLYEEPGVQPYTWPIYTWLISNSLIDRIS